MEWSQLGAAGAEGDRGRCVGPEGQHVVPASLRASTDRRGRPGFAYVEADEPALPGYLDQHESAKRPSTRLMVRRMTIVGSRLELNNRVTSDRRDRRSLPASASRECLPFVFEDLGPLQGLRGQSGQGREEP